MRRRELIGVVLGAATLPLGLRAQQSVRMRRIAYLTTNAENDPETQRLVAAFQRPSDW
jgi:hypothetical protein